MSRLMTTRSTCLQDPHEDSGSILCLVPRVMTKLVLQRWREKVISVQAEEKTPDPGCSVCSWKPLNSEQAKVEESRGDEPKGRKIILGHLYFEQEVAVGTRHTSDGLSEESAL